MLVVVSIVCFWLSIWLAEERTSRIIEMKVELGTPMTSGLREDIQSKLLEVEGVTLLSFQGQVIKWKLDKSAPPHAFRVIQDYGPLRISPEIDSRFQRPSGMAV